jgi:hypothetical protein
MKIDFYAFGRILVEGREYTTDVLIFPKRVDAAWRRKEGHRLAAEDLQSVVEADAETVVIGTGAVGAMTVPPEVVAALEARRIRVIVLRTKEAVETYNRIRGSGRVAAALHLTC